MLEVNFFKNLKDRLFRGFAIYLGSSVINKAIPFLLLPILTRYLSTEEYGVLAIYQVMISFGMPVIGMNMQNNITRNFFRKSKVFLARLVYNLLLVLWFSSTLFFIFIAAYTGLGGEQFSIPERWLYALPLIALMNMVNEFNLTILRNEKRALQFGAFEISKTAIDLSVTILFIVVYSYGWEGRVAGILFGTVVIGLISLLRTWRNDYLLFEFDYSQIKEIFLISLPLIPYALGNAIITLSDRLFIDQMVSTSAVGIYTVGYQFGMIMTLIVTAFNRTWSPWVYELLAEESYESKTTIVKATYLVGFSYLLLALAVTCISYFLLPFMTEESYHGGTEVVIWIALGYAFNGIFALMLPYSVHIGKTEILGKIGIVGAVLNLGLNYLLININNSVGAAQATLVTYIAMTISLTVYSNKIYPMPWNMRNKKNHM